ncbi:hypothetical protein CTAYLR_004808 [Chrysophaeum taylorii]|uniref:Thioredoxin domain-containing protein n=1 Tax=Chrysophaeum taylorii TaxID=2483200 RepID=A0AAD7XU02_9STRA|nr:hypothetical protein CTAYLR_004808 [Chrysophaeum taylorii]
MIARALLLLLGSGLVAARPTVRELRSHREYDALLAHHAAKTGLPVVVDFYSDSCGPCRMIAPVFKKVAQEYKDRAVFAKVNVATNRETSSRLRISSMPTFHFYLDGKKKNEFSGAGESQLRQLTASIVAEASRNNVALSLESLLGFYETADAKKPAADVRKIHEKCASMSGAGGACAGGAARELVKKLKAKFGTAPELGPRYVADAPPASSSSSSSSSSKTKTPPSSRERSSLASASTAELLEELARREDEVATVAVEAAREFSSESEEEEEEEDEGLPEYSPRRVWGEYAERVVILGGGPAGLSAAIYAARAGLSPIVVAPPGGGQLLGKGVNVENFPGVNATGPGLVEKMQQHAAEVGAAFYPYRVTRADLRSRPFILETSSGLNISTHAVVIATGANARWLGVDGEAEFRGGGVSSCATCDGFVMRGKDVAVIGGGDAAMEDALVLARTSKSVTVVHRRDKFRASRAMADRVLNHPLITVRWNATVKSFKGDQIERHTDDGLELVPVLRRLDLLDVATGEPAPGLDVSGAFVAIGHDPNTDLFGDQLDRDDSGYLQLKGGRFATELSTPGVFAAGDVADPVYRQAITSAGSGAAAALDAERYLSEMGMTLEPGAFGSGLAAEILEEILFTDYGTDVRDMDDDEDLVNVYDSFDSADILKYANAKADL